MKPLALLVAAIAPAALVGSLGRLADSAWVERLGWTLIHSVWQFAVIALTAGVLTWSLRRRSARARYVANVVLLGAMAVASGVTCCLVEFSQPVEMKHTPLAAVRAPEERAPHDANAWQGSPLPESAVNQPPEQAATPPIPREVEPRAPLQTQVSLHAVPLEHPLSSWVAGFRRQLAPRLPLLVSFWLAGMAMFSLRPVWGLWMQWRLRRVGLSPVPASVAQSLNDLARQLGLRRTVGIAQSVRVGVPMAVGYLRPLILLPGCVLTGLTAAQLEALLAHELAHIRRHDWLVNAFQLLVETVFFYHPAVWWLSRQIRQERENCCDDLAVTLVGDRGTVGRMLLALEELRERPAGLALAGTGGDLLSRVRRVVAKGRQPEPASREWLPAVVVLLLAGLGGTAWAMSAGTAEKKIPLPATPPTATPAATANAGGRSVSKSDSTSNAKMDVKNGAKPAAETLDVPSVTGRVVDGKGRPVEGARLWWVVLEDPLNGHQFTIEGTSNAYGRFALEAPADRKGRPLAHFPANTLWVLAPGRELKAVRAAMPTEALRFLSTFVVGKDVELEISLAPATPTEYTVSDEQGRPVAGAVLEPWRYRTPSGYEFVPIGIRELLRRTTNPSGRARLPSLSREDLYGVQIRAANFGTQEQRFDGSHPSSPHEEIELRATGCIEGRLIADDPQKVRGIQLMLSTAQPPKTVPVMLPDGTKQQAAIYGTVGVAPVETDAQGRFRVPEIAAGSITIDGGPIKAPFVARLPTSLNLKAGETLRIDVPMERVVLVRGTIRTDEPPDPVAGAQIAVRYGSHGYTEMVTSDRQGHFSVPVQAGPVYMRVIKMPREISERYQETGEWWSKQVDVPAGQREFWLPPIVLTATDRRTGTLIDQHGRPIADARVFGVRDSRTYGYADKNVHGGFSLQLPKKLGLNSYSVRIPVSHIIRPATIVKCEPLTLQID